MTDRQAAQLKKNGLDINVFVPEEGTLSFDVGILTFGEASVEISRQALVQNGFRLIDGSCDASLYPSDYSRAVSEYDRNKLSASVGAVKATLRRSVMNQKLFAPATYSEQAVFYMLFALLSCLWAVSLYIRLPDKRLRRDIAVITSLIVFWNATVFFKRTVYDGALVRYLWYLFYIPLLFLPAVFFAFSLHMRCKESSRSKKICRLIYVTSAVCFLAVLTNDLHQLVFSFPEGIKNGSGVYSYGFLYYIILSYIILTVLCAFVNIFLYNRTSGKKTRLVLPISLAALAFIYGISYILNSSGVARLSFDYTTTICVLCLGIVEICMQADLLPNNNKYHMFFSSANISLCIYDSAMNLAYKSAGVRPVGKAVIDDIRQSPVKREGRKIHDSSDSDVSYGVYALRGGYALLRQDMTEIKKLHGDLDQTNEHLKILNEELEKLHGLKQEQARIAAENKLMSELEAAIADKISEINSVFASLRQYNIATYLSRKKLSLIKIMIGYCKRKCNMIMSITEDGLMPAKDLALNFNLSFADAREAGVTGEAFFNTENVALDTAVCFYNYFEYILEKCLSYDSCEVLAAVTCEEGYDVLRMRVHLYGVYDRSLMLPLRFTQKLSSDGALLSALKEDDDILYVIKLRRPKGACDD